MTTVRKIAIIGVGPRGGYSLERLILELVEQNVLSTIHLSLFEATGNFGNGWVYDPWQNLSNWINITERILKLNQREEIATNDFKIPSFPSYHNWANKDFDALSDNTPDTYPPRAQVGRYLAQRFQSLVEPLIQAKIVTLYKEKVKNLQLLDNQTLQLSTDTSTYKNFDEVLLTIGHQPTELSQQIVNWDKFTVNEEHLHLFKSPYPVANYLQHKHLNEKSRIAIRGFGLAMIDVVRAIAVEFGEFAKKEAQGNAYVYQTEHEIKGMFIPFSLDGLPPVPKPLNARIDQWFAPSEAAILQFETKIGDKQRQKEAKSPQFLIEAFAPVAAAVYASLPHTIHSQESKETTEKVIMQWLEDQNTEHPSITPSKQSPQKSMENFVEMANGKAAISLDYCIGQVWRYCQPTIYEQLSFNECSDSVFAEIIALDESTKRYSYGPPVESIQQLVALAKAGVLELEVVNNPTIELTKKGWQFQLSDQTATATIMIDSVLDSPRIEAVRSPIVQNMLEDGLIEAVYDDLGVMTDEHAYLISKAVDKSIPIALLGRLAKGTIIGVDAILECFGPRPRQWAKQAASRHINFLNNNK